MSIVNGYKVITTYIIVKSQDMYDDLQIERALIVPNGVDLDLFKFVFAKENPVIQTNALMPKIIIQRFSKLLDMRF